jgi:hypothetical protein
MYSANYVFPCAATEHKLETYLSRLACVQGFTRVPSESTAQMRVRLSIMMTGDKHCGSRAMTVTDRSTRPRSSVWNDLQHCNYVNFNLISGPLATVPKPQTTRSADNVLGLRFEPRICRIYGIQSLHLFCDYDIYVSLDSSVALATSWMSEEPEIDS